MTSPRTRCVAIVTRVYTYGDPGVREPCGRLAKGHADLDGRAVPACNVHRRGLSEGKFR